MKKSEFNKTHQEEIIVNEGIFNQVTAELLLKAVNEEIRKRKRECYVMENKKEWFEIGQALKEKRLELGVSLTKMGQILKTSASRISNLENGKGVMMADHLIASYKLVLQLERIKRKGEYFNFKSESENGKIYRIESLIYYDRQPLN